MADDTKSAGASDAPRTIRVHLDYGDIQTLALMLGEPIREAARTIADAIRAGQPAAMARLADGELFPVFSSTVSTDALNALIKNLGGEASAGADDLDPDDPYDGRFPEEIYRDGLLK